METKDSTPPKRDYRADRWMVAFMAALFIALGVSSILLHQSPVIPFAISVIPILLFFAYTKEMNRGKGRLPDPPVIEGFYTQLCPACRIAPLTTFYDRRQKEKILMDLRCTYCRYEYGPPSKSMIGPGTVRFVSAGLTGIVAGVDPRQPHSTAPKSDRPFVLIAFKPDDQKPVQNRILNRCGNNSENR